MIPEIIAYYDYLLLLPYIVIFFLLARRFAKKNSETSREYYGLLINWWIKMIAGILYAWMIVYYYGYGDPIGYKDRSDALFDSILKDFENLKYMFLPAESFKNYLTDLGYANLPYFSQIEYYAESIFIVSKVSCISAFFSFNRFLITSFIFSNIAYYGFVIIYTTFKKIIKGYNVQLAIGCLFIPSCIFWGSGLAKEPLVIISLAVVFCCAVKLFFFKRTGITTIFQLLFFSYVLYTVKSYIFICFLFAFAFWILYNNIKALISKHILIKLFVVLSFLILTTSIAYFFANSFAEIVRGNIGDIINTYKDMYENMASISHGRGSLIEITDFDISSFEGILKFIPQGLVNVFLRPYPWEISNVLMIFTVLENLFFIFLIAMVIFKSRFFTKKLFINKNYQVFAILFTLTLAFVIGISTFNFGSMVRYKMPFLPFWASFLLVINKKLTENKRAAKKLNAEVSLL